MPDDSQIMSILTEEATHEVLINSTSQLKVIFNDVTSSAITGNQPKVAVVPDDVTWTPVGCEIEVTIAASDEASLVGDTSASEIEANDLTASKRPHIVTSECETQTEVKTSSQAASQTEITTSQTGCQTARLFLDETASQTEEINTADCEAQTESDLAAVDVPVPTSVTQPPIPVQHLPDPSVQASTSFTQQVTAFFFSKLGFTKLTTCVC